MDGTDYATRPGDWSEARRTLCAARRKALASHPDPGVRLGLLENPSVTTAEADGVAREELDREGDQTRVLIEVARSRKVSAAILLEVFSWKVWEVWAVLLHNPKCPREVLDGIASFTSNDAAVVREYSYLVSRAKEIIKEYARAEPGRTP